VTRRPVRANEWARMDCRPAPRGDHLLRAMLVGLIASVPLWIVIACIALWLSGKW